MPGTEEIRGTRPVSIEDVARRAGVSPKTVSNVVNNRPVVRSTTRERVLQAIRELDYHPNALARGLVTSSRRLIGLLLADITNPAYPEMVERVAGLARQAGFMVLLCNTGRDPAEEERYVKLLIEQWVDGVIIATSRTDSRAAEVLSRRGMQVVLFNRRPRSCSVSYVGVDNESGGYQATRHLIELGHRRIAFMRGDAHASTSQERERGYRQALAEAGIPVGEEMAVCGDYRADAARDAARSLLSRSVRPTAVFAANDVMALSTMDAAVEMGLRLPGDLAVVGFDDIEIASNRAVSLTTVRSDLGRLADEATHLLLDAIAHPDEARQAGPLHKILPVTLQVRRSSGGTVNV